MKETTLNEHVESVTESHIESVIALYIMTKLSLEDKTVRDPIHGDILWNHLETQVIDTETFQRLRRIRQLGTAHFVFPGAEYSRFQHSIGTLHMAQVLLQNIANNRFSQYQTFSKSENRLQDITFRLVVRLAALLHDAHEFPLSHTLEKEGRVFEEQWRDKTSHIKLLGKDSEIFKAISSYILELLNQHDTVLKYVEEANDLNEVEKKVLVGINDQKEEDKKMLAERFAKTIIAFSYKLTSGRKDKISDIAQELFRDEDVAPSMLDEDFLEAGNQIILDTVCADLLDYLARDFYFCGIRKMYDERFLKYATITDHWDAHRRKYCPVFAYRLFGKRQELKSSVLSSLFDTLELRYTVAELVHTHRTKNSFSAMAIEAFNFYYQSLDEEEKRKFVGKVMLMGDDELLIFLREQNASKHILDYYFRRRPYYEYILWNYMSIKNDPELKKALTTHIRKPRERFHLEQILVNWLRSSNISKKINHGDCLLYVMPYPEDLYKELNTNVVYLDRNGNPKTDTLSSLTEIESYSSIPSTLRTMIERARLQRKSLISKYENLWHTSLFISPDIDHLSLQPIIAQLMQGLFSEMGYNVFVITPKKPLPEELNKKLLTLSKKNTRQFKTFEEISKIK